MAKRALSHLALWTVGALSLLLLCARAACPELCDCPRAHHVLCANRGLRAVAEGSRNLTRLELQFNQIQRLHPKAFRKLVELEELYLGHNRISVLQPGTFRHLQNLRVLHVNDNQLRVLTGEEFGKLKRLVRLRLDKNTLELLSESVFQHFSSLMFLQLEFNQLRHIHHRMLQNLTKLHFLNLSHNKLMQLHEPSLFSRLRSLNTLLLSGNHITHIGARVFHNLRKLTKLSLSNNYILRLENHTLKGLARLRELALDNNKLTDIPAGALEPLTRLERLDLSNNRIVRMDSAVFSRLSRLAVLDLSNNRLRRISGHALASNPALFRLELSGNQWSCDCHMERLKAWMAEMRTRGKLVSALVRCQYPPTLEGKYLEHVSDTELLADWSGSGNCPAETRGSEAQEAEERLKRGRNSVEDMATQKNPMTELRPALSDTESARSSSALVETPATKTFSIGTWKPNDAGTRAGSAPDLKHHAAVSVVVSDACQLNRYITNVSAYSVTFDSITVSWSTPADTCTAPGQTLMFRILFDRFGQPDRFPRYVYTEGSARTVMLRELRPDSTYITCVESVVGGALCHMAPRDHCTGFVTTSPPSAQSDIKLQHVTAAMLATNALLILLVGGVWLGRVIRRRIKSRKSAAHTHVRHMYSTRRPFRAAMATTCVSSEFSGYQSGPRAEDGDLIQFPVERFFDGREEDFSLLVGVWYQLLMDRYAESVIEE
ncbi:TLR4 interactor with leucine rich repeats [Bagarius yarrelli]|uniref:TLR4 interactor with leucine rich repeats n=1 Tax=Bagarius yarrelli TaxID=175774 RepID=A0A556VV37_BAGYA|nr:TLR4 interactor with leucine rich repeats [Bagarius yarrelli]